MRLRSGAGSMRAERRAIAIRRIKIRELQKRSRVVGDLHSLLRAAERCFVHHLADVPPIYPTRNPASALAELKPRMEQYLQNHRGYEWLRSREYGNCTVCGRPAPVNQLQSRPLRTTCAHCSPAPTDRR
jgi:hypothetical protein